MFVDMIEEVTETHAGPTYSRAMGQHMPQAWAPTLRQAGLFKLVGYAVHANPMVLEGPDALADLLGAQAHVAAPLHGEQAHRGVAGRGGSLPESILCSALPCLTVPGADGHRGS
jgi:hypothetical protein